MSDQVIYVACPMPTYRTKLYDANLARVRARWPEAELVEVRDLYRDGRHFVATYRGHVGRCDMLVYFADAFGIVGKGVYSEIEYAKQRGMPVIYLDAEDGNEYDLLMINDGEDWTRYAEVVKL